MKLLSQNGSRSIRYVGDVFTIVAEEYETQTGERKQFEFAETYDVVRVYPITNQDELVLISESRYGIEPFQKSHIMRVVSGAIKPNESAKEAAIRELAEEIGYAGSRAEVFHVSRPMLKVRSKVWHVAIYNAAPSNRPHGDIFEQITPIKKIWAEVEDDIWNGKIIEDTIAFGLLTLKRNIHL